MNTNTAAHDIALQSYYKWHAHIYDATRWGFLFGRNELIRSLPRLPDKPRILEIGCGTGHNLVNLQAAFPNAIITGIDLSPTMLEIAEKKVDRQTELINNRYEASGTRNKAFDLILLSYSLTMMQTAADEIIPELHAKLNDDGVIAMVDFYSTPFKWFRRWMQKNHVMFDKTIDITLKKHFHLIQQSQKRAYLGLWSYFKFIGKK